MTQARLSSWLDRPVDLTFDHVLGDQRAQITLVEYGSYACPHCRAANERIAEVRDEFGARLRYVFRHRPLAGNELARRAAELAERAPDADSFWDTHVKLMTRSTQLTQEDLEAVAKDLRLQLEDPQAAEKSAARARARVFADEESARASGVLFTPTFFINSRRYDGPWDENSLSDALLGTLGYRVRAATLDFVSWGPSAGMLLLAATIVAVLLANTAVGPALEAFWEQPFGFARGGSEFQMSLRHWINDGLLTLFFLVVGLEIKRELTVGRLASRRSAALPIAAAIGGMIAPVVLYSVVIPGGPWSHGWGVPMATDTAFVIALLVILGARVPIELRIFLTAASIVDDIGAIMVVAAFYASELHLGYLAAAAAITLMLALLNRWHIYRLSPYLLLGAVLWVCILFGGLHATLAGVALALFIPTRPPPDLGALTAQATAILSIDAKQGEELRHGPSLPTLRALDAIHDRIESPAARLLRQAGARSSYVVLPIFALANAGVAIPGDVLNGHESLMLAIVAGLVIGKPLGILCACVLAVWLKVAVKPSAYSWRQLAGAGALAGIGFTISLFIAGQALPVSTDLAAAKVAVFAASLLSAFIGVSVLWRSGQVLEMATDAEPAVIARKAASRPPV